MMTQESDAIAQATVKSTKPIDTIPVHVSYEIIRLFSEGLYQSPHKAIEELVSNGYDANADRVHVLLPEEPESESEEIAPLWVIDNGDGMDAKGFRQLWRVADSAKAELEPGDDDRAPIGQFGIGKLAAYVLAWKLMHISKTDDSILMIEMNFHDVTGKHQFETTEPVELSLYGIAKAEAMEILSDVKVRDPQAWAFMFGDEASSSWTAAALSDFKNLYERLSIGRLRWVLSTGLPLHSGFHIFLNGKELASSKERLSTILELEVGGEHDAAAEKAGLRKHHDGGVSIPGIEGRIAGVARIYERRLTKGKSDQYGRSHGFFIRVRGRVINLEDELFGIEALNHAAWVRFSMEVDADGLRDFLLSSREGVRETEATRRLRNYLHQVFNVCRQAYDEWKERQLVGLDIERLLADAPSLFVTEPLLFGVREIAETGSESFYIATPSVAEDVSLDEWLDKYGKDVKSGPFRQILFEHTGERDRALRYVPDTRALIVNVDHPFMDKLVSNGKNRHSATLFGSSEVMMDVLLREHGVPRAAILDFMDDRDRILRLLAGDHPSTAAEVLRLLSVANRNEHYLERAVGAAFGVLGFEYERRGGNRSGPDGVLYARLGRDTDSLADYRLVYDAKQSNSPTVSADKINLASIEDFRLNEGADYAFFIAEAYAAEDKVDGKLNRTVKAATGGEVATPVSLLKLDHLSRLVRLHYRYGVTLTRMRRLFEEGHTVPEVEKWVVGLEKELSELEPPVPLRLLLEGIEKAKSDVKARPNVHSVRAVTEDLKQFTPEKLIAALQAIETIVGGRWIEVEKSGDVRVHHNVDQIIAEVDRRLLDLLGEGINSTAYSQLS